MPLPAWVPVVKEKDQWRLLSKIRSEAEAGRSGGIVAGRAAAAALLHDEHNH
jgi:hypothetical protein